MYYLANYRLLIVAFISSLLLACGANPIEDNQQPAVYTPETNDTVSTLEFIPQLRVDKVGKPLPYEAQANPYIKRLSFVRAEAINLFKQAQVALNADDLTGAQATAQEMTEKYKNLSGPWVILGDVAVRQKRYSDAEKYFSKALLINADNVNAYLRLAQVKRIQGQFIDAKKIYADALAVWKDFPEAHLNLAVLYDLYMNDDVKAQKHIEAYQFLTHGENGDVARWLEEIGQRTGMPVTLKVQPLLQPGAQVGKPVS